MQAGWEERRRRIDAWVVEGRNREGMGVQITLRKPAVDLLEPATFREQTYLSKNKHMSSR